MDGFIFNAYYIGFFLKVPVMLIMFELKLVNTMLHVRGVLKFT